MFRKLEINRNVVSGAKPHFTNFSCSFFLSTPTIHDGNNFECRVIKLNLVAVKLWFSSAFPRQLRHKQNISRQLQSNSFWSDSGGGIEL